MTAPEKSSSTEKEMPFLDHLEELRWRLIKSIIAVVAGAAGSFYFMQEIFDFLVRPYRGALKTLAAATGKPELGENARLVFLGPTAGFMIYLKLALTAGVVIALPVIFYQLWKFVAPGLLAKERMLVPRFTASATLCFLAGAAFCYYLVLPYGLSFLLGFQTEELVAMITIEEYFGFVTTILLVFGVLFEMPVLSYLLARLGLLTPEFLRQKRRYGIVSIFILAAVLTPTVDAFTQVLLAVPLMILYEVSIWVAKVAMPEEMRSTLKTIQSA
jgi:sec-independent protein translocase protein TatC